MNNVLSFVPSKFRKKAIPVLFIALLPSLILDAIFIISFVIQKSIIPNFLENTDIKTVIIAILADFVLLQSWVIIIYLRIFHQHRRSFIRVEGNGYIYRKFKLMGFVKTDWKNGYGFNYDHYLTNIQSISSKMSGKLIIYGDFKVVKKAQGTEAYINQWQKNRVVIPGYFEDMEVRENSGQ